MGNNAVTYKDLYLSFGEVISISELQIIQRPNYHGQLRLSAVLDSNKEEDVFYEIPEDITVHYMEDDKEKILFKGVITDSSMKRVGNHMELKLKAYDTTYLLDTKRKIRSFQDLSRTNHSIIAEIMEEYPDGVCIKNLPEKKIGGIWFQYEETDWEFLCRFLSSYTDSLYADATYHTARFQAGLSAQDIHVDWESLPYRMGKNLERYDCLSKNGFSYIMPQQFVEYYIESYDLYALGSRLNFKGAQWYISRLERVLREGLLVNIYELRQKEGMLMLKQYNRRITGISADGKIVKVNRDKVRVTINGDMTVEQGTYWFPFSAVAASSDGSGFYSMPEEGDSIRVYFPTHDETDGYVITKHDSHTPPASPSGGGSGNSGSGNIGRNSYSVGKGAESSGGGISSGEAGSYGGGTGVAAAAAAAGQTPAAEEKQDPMADPGKRNIFTQDGNIVQMVPEGVILSSGKSSISLKKSGEVIIDAPKGISISAGKKLNINGQKVSLEAGTMMELVNDAGADIKILKSSIKLHAQEIFEN